MLTMKDNLYRLLDLLDHLDRPDHLLDHLDLLGKLGHQAPQPHHLQHLPPLHQQRLEHLQLTRERFVDVCLGTLTYG